MGRKQKMLLAATLSLGTGAVLFSISSGTRTTPAASGATQGRRARMANPDTPMGVFDTGEHEIKMLTAALKKKPEHTPLLIRLAQLSEEAGRKPEAAVYLRQVLRIEPDNSDALLELGKLQFDAGDVNGALENTKRILVKHPQHSDALYNIGALYGNLGDTTRAHEYWTRLIAAEPHSTSAVRARQMIHQLTTP